MDSTSFLRTSNDAADAPTPMASEDQLSTAEQSPRSNSLPASASNAADLVQQVYGPIAGELAAVEARLHLELQSPYESLAQVLRHGTQLGGKRLRPAMVLLSAAAVNEICEDHVVLATVIEMVHTATLIHDDVLDEADTRRHVPTINAKWNNHTSILLGDFLFAQSFRLAATLDSTEACRMIGEASRRVCEGELRQVLDRNTLDLSQETYIDILRGKTAELCQVACQLGARHAGGDDEMVNALAEYGNAVGIAFQIADDYLDLWGDGATVGKTLGTDIEQGKITLPIIRLLETADESERQSIVDVLTGPAAQRVDKIRPWLEKSDAKAYTASVAEEYRCTALNSLGRLPASSAKEALITIANFAVNRSF